MVHAGGHAMPSSKVAGSVLALGGRRPEATGVFALSRSVSDLVAAFSQEEGIPGASPHHESVKLVDTDIPLDAETSSPTSVSAVQSQVLQLQAMIDGVVLEAFNHLRQEQQDLTARVELLATREQNFVNSMKFEALYHALTERVDAIEAQEQEMAAASERSERRLERVRAEVGELRSHGLLSAARVERRIRSTEDAIVRLVELSLQSPLLATKIVQEDGTSSGPGTLTDRKAVAGEDSDAKCRPVQHRSSKRRARKAPLPEQFPMARAAMESLWASS